MIVTLDTEFLDDGRTIELISFALVAADGREFYAINSDADWPRIMRDTWVADNVVRKHLPFKVVGEGMIESWTWDERHPDYEFVMPKSYIARRVEKFLRAFAEPDLWAYYSASDHVVGYQLFGSMIEASSEHGWPMRTSCLMQEEESVKRQIRRSMLIVPGSSLDSTLPLAVSAIGEWTYRRPEQDEATEHHALHDARHDMDLARWLGLTT